MKFTPDSARPHISVAYIFDASIHILYVPHRWWPNHNISLLSHSLKEQMLYFLSPNIIFNLSPKYSYNFDYPMGFTHGYVQIKYPLVRKTGAFIIWIEPATLIHYSLMRYYLT